MKSTQKILKWAAAVATTLVITTSTAMAVTLGIGDGDAITAEVWWKISTVMAKLTAPSGEVRVDGHVKIKKICAVSDAYSWTTDLTLTTGQNITAAKWTQLTNIMAKMDVAKDAWALAAIPDDEDVLSLATQWTPWTVYVHWEVCVLWADWAVWGTWADADICLKPTKTIAQWGNCFGS